MLNYEKKKKLQIAGIYFLQFLFFAYAFYRYPPRGDRYMESTTLFAFENLWRYIYTQRFWFTVANGRIFSNLGTCLIDSAPLLMRALVYSGVIVACSVVIVNICGKKKSMFAPFLCFLLFVSVSEGIKDEVYYYATGLYLTSFLFLIVISLIIIKSWKNECFITLNKTTFYFCIVVFLGSAWLETVSISVNITLWLLLAYCIITKNTRIKTLTCYCVSSLMGFILLASSMLYVKSQGIGKLTQLVKIDVPAIRGILQTFYVNFAQQNSLIFLILLVFALAVVIHEKWLHKVWEKCVFYTLTICSGVFCLMNIIFGIYSIISSNPSTEYNVNAAKLIMAWRPLGNPSIRAFFDTYSSWSISRIIVILLVMWAIIFFVFALLRSKDKIHYFVFGCCILGGILIAFPPIGWADPRVMSLAVFTVIALTVFLASKIPVKKNGLVVVLLISLGFQCSNMYLTCESAGRIDDIRKERSASAAALQATNQWNYETNYVSFPITQTTGLITMQVNVDSVVYPVFLYHYGLDPKTKVVYEVEAQT